MENNKREEMISKELLSEVLDFSDFKINEYMKIGTHIHYTLILEDGEVSDSMITNIYELAFQTRDYFKTKSKHLTLNQSIDDIFKEANSIYEGLFNDNN